MQQNQNNQKEQNSTRKLTVYASYMRNANKFTVVPELRLKGHWLKNLGYSPGTRVQITHKGNQLIITFLPHAQV